MDQGKILFYDGSFDGFLTCVFTVFEQKINVASFSIEASLQQDFFADPETIITDLKKAQRVKNGLKKKISPQEIKQLYVAFLSEHAGIELLLLKYIKSVYSGHVYGKNDFGNPLLLTISQIAKTVGREKHRMEAFVRFMLTKDDIYFAHIEPDFNVLPLILPHFESRYANQKWIIYDLKRKFGLYYNLEKTEYISLDLNAEVFKKNKEEQIFAKSELEFQELWKQYFKSTNIESRKNMKLHVQHVPKRYWKYLSEKSALRH